MTNLVFCYHELRKKGRRVRPHVHNCHEIVFYGGSAQGELTINDTPYSFHQSCVAVIPQRNLHSELHYLDTEVYFIGFTSTLPVSAGVWKGMAHTKRIFQDIIYEAKNQHYGYETLLDLKIQELLAYIERGSNEDSAEAADLVYCRRYIEENYMREINICELSQLANYSPDRFRHLFVELFGISPKQYIIAQRLSHAKELLTTSKLSCAEIAQICGFSDSTQMAKMFKKHFGITPTEYQKTKTETEDTILSEHA